MFADYIIISIIIITGAILSVVIRKLTIAAAIAGSIIGILVFRGAGYTGVMMMATFFMLGSAATSWQIKRKQDLGFAELNKGKRSSMQVIANAGVAGFLGILVLIYPLYKNIFVLMIAASFASATADTLSSELGNIYGRKFYNIITFKKDERGLDGVVSLEGTLFGIAGSFIIAVIYSCGFNFSAINLLLIIISGTIGNISDSIIGAVAERKNLINNTVNFINTFFAAIAMLIFYNLFYT